MRYSVPVLGSIVPARTMNEATDDADELRDLIMERGDDPEEVA